MSEACNLGQSERLSESLATTGVIFSDYGQLAASPETHAPLPLVSSVYFNTIL